VVLVYTLNNMSVGVSSPGTLDFLPLATIYPYVVPVYEGHHALRHVDLTLEVCRFSWVFGLVHHCVLNLRGPTSVHFPHFLEKLTR